MLDSLGEAHGYAIMAELKDRVGGGWAEPGAIYPALLALVGTGHVQAKNHDGTRVYSLTNDGHRVAATQRSSSRWASLTARAAEGEDRVSVGSLLDTFAEASAVRRRLAHAATEPDRGDPRARERGDRRHARGRRERWMSSPGWPHVSEEATRIARRQWFWLHAAVFVPTQVILFVVWSTVDAQFPWFAFPLLGWGMILAVHGVYAFVMKTPEES